MKTFLHRTLICLIKGTIIALISIAYIVISSEIYSNKSFPIMLPFIYIQMSLIPVYSILIYFFEFDRLERELINNKIF
jgi:hypothetical protein